MDYSNRMAQRFKAIVAQRGQDTRKVEKMDITELGNILREKEKQLMFLFRLSGVICVAVTLVIGLRYCLDRPKETETTEEPFDLMLTIEKVRLDSQRRALEHLVRLMQEGSSDKWCQPSLSDRHNLDQLDQLETECATTARQTLPENRLVTLVSKTPTPTINKWK